MYIGILALRLGEVRVYIGILVLRLGEVRRNCRYTSFDNFQPVIKASSYKLINFLTSLFSYYLYQDSDVSAERRKIVHGETDYDDVVIINSLVKVSVL